jgi:hypothetical protein
MERLGVRCRSHPIDRGDSLLGVNHVSLPFPHHASIVLYFALKAETHFCRTGLPGVIPGFPSSGNPAIIKVFFWTPQGERRTPAHSPDPSSTLTTDI